MSLRHQSGWLLAVLLGTAGCRVCCPSYDYCNPTGPFDTNSECCGHARRGSVFSSSEYVDGATYVEDGTYYEEVAPESAPATRSGDAVPAQPSPQVEQPTTQRRDGRRSSPSVARRTR